MTVAVTVGACCLANAAGPQVTSTPTTAHSRHYCVPPPTQHASPEPGPAGGHPPHHHHPCHCHLFHHRRRHHRPRHHRCCYRCRHLLPLPLGHCWRAHLPAAAAAAVPQAPSAGGCWPGPECGSVGLRWCLAPKHHCCCSEAKTPAHTAAPAAHTTACKGHCCVWTAFGGSGTLLKYGLLTLAAGLRACTTACLHGLCFAAPAGSSCRPC